MRLKLSLIWNIIRSRPVAYLIVFEDGKLSVTNNSLITRCRFNNVEIDQQRVNWIAEVGS